MKHLQSINEYQRTVGFRYSDPKEKFNIKVYINGELTEEEIKNTLNDIDVILFGDIQFEETPNDYIPEEEDDVVNVISFDISVYNEKEIERIMEDFTKIIYLDYKIKTLDVSINPKRN
jgi:hypothetical protein